MKKLVMFMQFGRQENWVRQYIANVNTLAKDGWDWVYITDQDIQSEGNFKVFPITLPEFCDLVNTKFGIRPNYQMKPDQTIDAHMGIYFIAFAHMFPELVQGYDFWGFTNLDVVFGRLSKWVSDDLLNSCDVFGNDPNAINGVFSMFRNYDFVNRLFMEHPDWFKAMQGKGIYAFEEKQFSDTVRQAHAEGRINFKSAHWAQSERMGTNGNDLILYDNGALVNKVTGEEMAMFHFSLTKRWPNYERKNEHLPVSGVR